MAGQGFQIENGRVVACNGPGLEKLLRAGADRLAAHAGQVNSLNVFPVPDGDTGTNMLLTMEAALRKLADLAGPEVGLVAQAAAQGALMGGRGNSGVILSQFLQGIATGLAGQSYFTPRGLAEASQLGVKWAYQGVAEPVEGTILTVARVAAEAAHRSAAAGADLLALFTAMVQAAKEAQANTPHLLPRLQQAGVTDAGGQGLVYILEGGLHFLQGAPPEVERPGAGAPFWSPAPVEDDYGYDVQFLIHGEGLDLAQIRAHITGLGHSAMVVGDSRLVKVHVHAADPGIALSYGLSQGFITDVVVENMAEQAREFGTGQAAGQPDTDIAAICVMPGEGLKRLALSLGVGQVIGGGQAANPSTEELLAAVDQVQAGEILLLPNNRNLILAARQVETISAKRVRIVPTRTVPQGITALLAFNYQADLATNARQMWQAARQVRTIEITQAARPGSFNGLAFRAGEMLGLLDEHLAGVGRRPAEVVLALLAKVEPAACELVTIYFGQESSQARSQALARKIEAAYPDMEVEIYDGGQPYYPYIISVE